MRATVFNAKATIVDLARDDFQTVALVMRALEVKTRMHIGFDPYDTPIIKRFNNSYQNFMGRNSLPRRACALPNSMVSLDFDLEPHELRFLYDLLKESNELKEVFTSKRRAMRQKTKMRASSTTPTSP